MIAMAEMESISSIIGVAGAGFRLSLILNAVSCEVASEGLEVHSISKTVTLFSLTLKQTGTALQTADSVHSGEALESIQAIADEATRVFDEFNDMLDRVRTKPADSSNIPTIQQRFRWCFKKHRVTYLLAELESLKLSLSIIFQVLQLGKLMASTSKHDSPEEVAAKIEAIKQERAETQNVLIVRYWQMSKMERLFENSRLEYEDDKIAALEQHDDELALVSSGGSSQLTIEAPPPEYAMSTALIKHPSYSLGELEQTLHKIKESPKNMVQVSDEAIDPLLDRWTRWHDVRERKHARDSGGRYVPSVQNLYEDDEDRPYYERYRERDNSPRGFYLEGTTTDWRKPNSVAARQDAIRRRQKYTNYQPSVSAASSDLEDSPNSNNSKKRGPRHHIIDSSSESSDSQPEQPRIRRRRSSGSPTTERKVMFPDGSPLAHTYSAGNLGSRKIGSPGSQHVTPGSRLAPSPHLGNSGLRPYATPTQMPAQHSLSSPLPPIHTSNALNPYETGNTHYQPYPQHPPYGQYSSSASSRYTPQAPPAPRVPPPGVRIALPPRPGSRDGPGGGRSPSRISYADPGVRTTSYGKTGEEKRQSRDKTKKNLREGATKGLLGAGAIAGFLEALEGLDI